LFHLIYDRLALDARLAEDNDSKAVYWCPSVSPPDDEGRQSVFETDFIGRLIGAKSRRFSENHSASEIDKPPQRGNGSSYLTFLKIAKNLSTHLSPEIWAEFFWRICGDERILVFIKVYYS
jgi:hypothetical protein